MSPDRPMMKKRILSHIYTAFDQWTTGLLPACYKGCCHCCSQNVTMTALEGRIILDAHKDPSRQIRLKKILQSVDRITPPGLTTNGFAKACLNNREPDQPSALPTPPCPFLEDSICSIYAVRPMNCRCFFSLKRCAPGQAASIHEFVLSGATAVLQLIEHLDQGEPWGNMLDILRLDPADGIDVQGIKQRLKTSLPLPGFLIPPEDFDRVQPLIQTIFSQTIGGKSIETILNGG